MIETTLYIRGLKIRVEGSPQGADPDVGIWSPYFEDVAISRTNGIACEDGFAAMVYDGYGEELQKALGDQLLEELDSMAADRAADNDYFDY